MVSALKRLVSLASAPVGQGIEEDGSQLGLPVTLSSLLQAKDGFFAFEGALHVRPFRSAGGSSGIQEWNAPDLWRSWYPTDPGDLTFFAQDIFGEQWGATAGGEVLLLSPETGEVEPFAPSIEAWAARVLDDVDLVTGYPLAHDWQAAHGPLRPNERLLPKTPFVLGGEYKLGNLYALDALTGMRLRGDLAKQLRDLPDGAHVRYNVVE